MFILSIKMIENIKKVRASVKYKYLLNMKLKEAFLIHPVIPTILLPK
jgi:hypothetical protein